MGNSGSSSSATDSRFASASRAFTHKELEDLRSLFDSLAAHSQSNGNYVSPPALKAYIGIDGLLGDRVFYLVLQNRRDQKLIFEDLVIGKGTYEKGTNDDMDNEFIYLLLDVFADGIVGRSELEAVLTTMHDNLFHKTHSSEPKAGSCQEIMEAFIPAANSASDEMSFEDSENGVPLRHQSGNFFAVT